MNLLRLFEFYLMAMFVIGTARRIEFYRAITRLAIALARRYRKLFGVVRERSGALFTWSIFLPALVTLLLWMSQSILTRLVFPHAELTIRELFSRWWFPPLVLLPAICVLVIDGYFLFRVGEIDTKETEKYFHQAESWIGTWKAKAVKTVTLGYVNPHEMVHAEVAKALDAGGKMINVTLWWTALQTGLRVTLGIALWMVWTVGPLASGAAQP